MAGVCLKHFVSPQPHPRYSELGEIAHVSERNRFGEPGPVRPSWLSSLYAVLNVMVTDSGILGTARAGWCVAATLIRAVSKHSRHPFLCQAVGRDRVVTNTRLLPS